MRIFAIETSCDETSLAIVDIDGAYGKAQSAKRKNSAQQYAPSAERFLPRVRVKKLLVASQIKLHREFGGVVPNLAKREHLKNLPLLYKKMFGHAYRQAGVARPPASGEKKLWDSIDYIAVTVGPGLEPALWAGITFAQELEARWEKPVIGTNHIEGHLLSFLLSQRSIVKGQLSKVFPAIALTVSGGHTMLIKMDSLTKWQCIGETRDDAAGEAFDKVARLLGLPYPGGPEIERIAHDGDPEAIPFPRPMLKDKSYDFSFSGLKTAVLYYLRSMNHELGIRNKDGPKKSFVDSHKFVVSHRLRADIAASFQAAAIDTLGGKAIRAAREYGARSLILAGGVASNKTLRRRIEKEAKKLGLNYFVPDFLYNTDNAAMIAVAAYFSIIRKKNPPLVAKGDMRI
ncbi:MAG: tRNA (adenosine(37)-N6)-threonylcarbamoyltransferase complex transferase subunit TsaD [bacterium]|nr:tRNA (adenosine(37)-N6)-threonylcarbamoyltransferase complex transferase subunit TsaD [bacterium]